MSEVNLFLSDEAATLRLGQFLGENLRPGGTLFLDGTLGAGKTTLARGLLGYLGHTGAVKSPTYTLVEPYQLADLHVFHFDLYRLGDPEELEFMGIRDYFAPGHICVVEWPSRGEGFLPLPDLTIALEVAPPGRLARLSAATGWGRQLLASLPAQWQETFGDSPQ